MPARRWHAPGIAAVALACAGIALFVALGGWQLRRAHEKVELFAAFDAAATQPPVDLAQARRLATPSRYPRVRVVGRYDALHAYVLDNQVRDGKVGVMVFDVFEPAEGGPPLLVNRGFLARDARGARPAIPPPPSGARTLTALYAPPPGAGLRMGGNALPRQTDWPKLAIYLDPGEVSADLGRTLDARVLLVTQDGDADAPFVREWRPEVFPPARHYGYAFTWFTFAAVVAAVFVAMHWRKEKT